MKKISFKLCLLFFIVTFINLTSIAQSIHFNWVKAWGTINALHGNAYGIAEVLDSNKFVIVAGGFNNTVDFDGAPNTFNLTSKGGVDILFTKYDSSGNFIWAKQIGSSVDEGVTDMKSDSHGNLFITGFFQSTLDFDPGPSVFNLITVSPTGFLLKLDGNGNFIWAKKLSFRPDKLDIDAADNIIMTGSFNGTKDFDPGTGADSVKSNINGYEDIFIVKLDSAANFTWMKQLKNQGTSVHRQFGLESDPAGNIILVGSFSDIIDFDPGTASSNLTSAGKNDGFCLKLDPMGNFIWIRQFGGDGIDMILALEVDKDGNVYSTGGFTHTVDFDPGPQVYALTSTDERSCFISKLDKNGNFVYAKNFIGYSSAGQALALDSSNNLYISGLFKGPIDFDPGPGVHNVDNSGIFTAKFDPSGNFLWATSYSAENTYFESIYSAIKVDILKNVYYTGGFAGTVDFDPTGSVHMVPATGNFAGFLQKVSQCNNSLKIINAQSCTSFGLNNINYTKSGTYYQTLTNSVGCDSIIQLNLAIENKLNDLSVTTCGGYLFNGQKLTSSGNYTDTFKLAGGCDSVVHLKLTITKITSGTSQTACGSYEWNGEKLTSTGTYIDTFKLNNGCDSIAFLNLTINEVPSPYLGKDSSICPGDSIIVNPGVFESYLWNDNTVGNSLIIKKAGTYWVKVTAINNCEAADSLHILPSGQCEGDECNVKIKIYPTPFHNLLIVDKNRTKCLVRMNLYNDIGQLVLKGQVIYDGKNSISLQYLPNGAYLYKIYTGNKILLVGKIIKQ